LGPLRNNTLGAAITRSSASVAHLTFLSVSDASPS
jgi:hypothetical protein